MKETRTGRSANPRDARPVETAPATTDESRPGETATPAQDEGTVRSEPVCTGIRDLLGSFSEQTGAVFS